jgi:F420-dependent oxidoreductase-like protein
MAQHLRFGMKTSPLSVTPEALLEVWRAADALPIFEHAWVFDHFMAPGADPTRSCLESWTLLAALAAQTSRIRVGVMVSGNTYRHPAVLAKMAATVDVIAHGRLNFGLGTGWDEKEHAAYGIPLPAPGERIRRFAEACELIRRLWSESEVTFAGRYYQLREAYCEPKPVQQPAPPFVLAGEGDHTLRVIARYADVWDCSVETPEEYQRKNALMDSYCAAIGRDPGHIVRSRHITVNLSDPAATLRETRRYVDAGATYIVLSVPAPYSASVAQRLADEVAEPLRAEYVGR